MSQGITLEKLQVIIEAQTAQFKEQIDKAMSDINKQLNQVDKTTAKFGNKFTSMFSKIKNVLVAAGIGKFLIDFGKASIKVASELEEVQNVVDVSFGNMSYKIENFSKKALKAFGMSELAAKKTASMFMAMGSGMGFSDEKASNMAIQITGLSADMASFFNISQQQATTALKSIWTGETEALKNYGIAMTQANLQQFAYKKGINKSISAMSQAEQVTLRYMYVTDALKLAQGDFARTSNSWSNQVRLLSERFKQLGAIIGSGLIQMLTPAIQVINFIIGKIVLLAQAISSVLGGLFGAGKNTSNAMGSVGNATDKAIGSQKGLNNALQKTENQAKKTANAMLSIDELNVLSTPDKAGSEKQQSNADGFDLDFSNLDFSPPDETPIQKFAERIKKFFEPLKSISLENLSKSIKGLGDALGKITKTIGSGLEWLYFNILVPLAKWTIQDAVPKFLGLLASTLNVLNGVLIASGPLFDWLWFNFFEPLASWTGDVIIGAIESMTKALEGFSKWIKENQGFIEFLATIILSIYAAFKLVNIALAIYNGITVFATAITSAFTAVMAVLTSPITAVVLAIGGIIAIVVLLIKHWDLVVATAKSCWDGIVKIFVGIGEWFGKNVTTPISEGFKGMVNAVIGFFEAMINGLIGAFEGFINFFVDGINGIIDGVNGLSQYIGFTITPFEKTQLARVSIPRFAQGGIVSGPTLGLMGEYPGATSNPEVIAPLSDLKGLIKDEESYYQRDTQIDLLRKMVDLMEMLLDKENLDFNKMKKLLSAKRDFSLVR